MLSKDMRKEKLLIIFILVVSFVYIASAVPEGPTIADIKNETKSAVAGTIVNESEGGGYIYTLSINGTQQTSRWKAYIGNVTGSLTLDDATGSTIYDWELTTSIAGEVYATRNSTTPSWTTVNCTWANYGAGNDSSDRGMEEDENDALNHTSPDDNITSTFDTRDNAGFYVGNIEIVANDCYTTNSYIDNATQSTQFEETLLADSAGSGLIYSSILEEDVGGYNGDTYDFQMIVPEVGYQGFSSSTAYYFYVEIS